MFTQEELMTIHGCVSNTTEQLRRKDKDVKGFEKLLDKINDNL